GVAGAVDRAGEGGGVVEWDHMRGVRENGELAVRDVLIDLDGVLVGDRIVIARQYQGGWRDGFERFGFNVRLLEHHADQLELALAAWCVAIGSGDRRHRLPD